MQKKRTEMQTKAEFKINAKMKKREENKFSILKFIQKKSKMGKMKHIYFDFFAFISPVHFFAF